jgi:hypothetical protein
MSLETERFAALRSLLNLHRIVLRSHRIVTDLVADLAVGRIRRSAASRLESVSGATGSSDRRRLEARPKMPHGRDGTAGSAANGCASGTASRWLT